MTRKVSVNRRWIEPIPLGQNGQPIPENLWPRRRKHVWIVRWFAPSANGKIVRQSKQFESREDAEAFRNQRAEEFDRSPSARRVARNITIGEFAAEFGKLGQGPRGIVLRARSLQQSCNVLDRLVAFLGSDTKLSAVTSADAARFVASARTRKVKASPAKPSPKSEITPRPNSLLITTPASAGTGTRAVEAENTPPTEKTVKLSEATVEKIKRTAKACFSVAINPLGYIRENPFAALKNGRLDGSPIRYVTPSEFAAMLSASGPETMPTGLWWRCYLSICYTAGLRYAEAVNLVWADVDFAKGTIRVSPKPDGRDTVAWSPKDREVRTIPLPAATIDMLTKLQASSPEGHAYVFLPAERLAFIKAAKTAGKWKETQGALNNFARSFRLLVKRAAKDAPALLDGKGDPAVSVHDLRRTAITNWSKVANMQTVMALAGHSNIETTRRYYAAVTEDQLDKVRGAACDLMNAAISHANAVQVSAK